MKTLSGNSFYYMRALYEAGRPVCKEECIRLVFELYGIKHSTNTGKAILRELLAEEQIKVSSKVANGKKRTFYAPAYPIDDFYKTHLEKFVNDTFLGDYDMMIDFMNKSGLTSSCDN